MMLRTDTVLRPVWPTVPPRCKRRNNGPSWMPEASSQARVRATVGEPRYTTAPVLCGSFLLDRIRRGPEPSGWKVRSSIRSAAASFRRSSPSDMVSIRAASRRPARSPQGGRCGGHGRGLGKVDSGHLAPSPVVAQSADAHKHPFGQATDRPGDRSALGFRAAWHETGARPRSGRRSTAICRRGTFQTGSRPPNHP